MSRLAEASFVQPVAEPVAESGMSKDCGCSDGESPSSEGKDYYPLEDCVRVKKHKCTKYCAHGINLLNRESLEIHEIKERLARRKQQHIKVERRRRELINSSIEEIARILPPSYLDHKCKNARGLVLQQTIQYLHALAQENATLKQALNQALNQ